MKELRLVRYMNASDAIVFWGGSLLKRVQHPEPGIPPYVHSRE